MPLGAALWTASESFYNGLTLSQYGIAPEQEFASRRGLSTAFPRYGEFWKRHVCPATTRPCGTDFRSGISDIVCKVAATSYSVMCKLLDAEDSLGKVQAGDLGERYRNWRDAIEAAGNALQLATELQFAVAGNPRDTTLPSVAAELGVAINPFPDWKKNWAANRETASKYRHYLVHQGLVYTVHVEPSGEVLVLGYAAFAAGVNWKHAEASYNAKPSEWQSLATVCQAVFDDTVAFIERTYERLLDRLDLLLTNPAYQRLWGWDNNTTPATWPPPQAALSPGSPPVSAMIWMQATSASKTVPGSHKTIISSGGCMP
jgi:hypothetical protein